MYSTFVNGTCRTQIQEWFPDKLTLQGKDSLHNFTMQICLTSNHWQITLLKVCCHGEKLDFQTLWTSSIHKYLVNLQNFNSWLDQVLTTKQDQKLHEQDWTPGAAPYSSPPHSIKELPWWKITYFVTAFSVIRPDFCIQFFHLTLFQVHYYNLQRSHPPPHHPYA